MSPIWGLPSTKPSPRRQPWFVIQCLHGYSWRAMLHLRASDIPPPLASMITWQPFLIRMVILKYFNNDNKYTWTSRYHYIGGGIGDLGEHSLRTEDRLPATYFRWMHHFHDWRQRRVGNQAADAERSPVNFVIFASFENILVNVIF